ncbi:NADH-quinone oxidoreductase subunit NuoE [Sphingomonas jatrophae]|uniref:NADH dehydrogenase subunit E n=1 Tax=Sphingomonas jatrophae TaxID=1166337 RepID=A0A1I6JVE0_9SPHN|nr:NADH-quinone oxidoreductase subunit NuoE [Sphingomonas jatrophae]SFR82952.1 NADH dehydrogenase subunit E [Sphingomonas jatrophae]
MADAPHIPDEAEMRARWGGFAWDDQSAPQVDGIIARYPPGRQHSAIMPLLYLAQAQVGRETGTYGWLPVPVIEHVARTVDMPYIRALEVVSFYTMFNQAPVGRHLVQVCGTTPCMLRGSDDVMAACKNKGLIKGKTTPDGLFTLMEVECMGTCANAPMVQINDDNYEDLTYDSMTEILETLAAGGTPKPGPQIDRHASAPEGGPTTLKAMVSENHDYRGEWA